MWTTSWPVSPRPSNVWRPVTTRPGWLTRRGMSTRRCRVDTPLSFRPMIGLSGIARLILGIAGLAIGALVALGARAGWRRWRSGRVGA